jgi:DNA-binding NtrC family response regulator
MLKAFDQLVKLSAHLISPSATSVVKLKKTIDPITLLLVEDDAVQQEQLTMLLRQRGGCDQIICASSISEALQEISKAHVLVLDWRIGRNGERGGRTIFNAWMGRNGRLPCLVLSAYMTNELELELLGQGASNALSKPAGLQVLLRLISEYVHQIRQELELEKAKTNITILKGQVDKLAEASLKQKRNNLVMLFLVLLAIIFTNGTQLGSTVSQVLSLIF